MEGKMLSLAGVGDVDRVAAMIDEGGSEDAALLYSFRLLRRLLRSRGADKEGKMHGTQIWRNNSAEMPPHAQRGKLFD